MTPKPLTPDLAEALRAAGGEPLAVIDPASQHVYLVVDQAVHERAMNALRYQETVESIRPGVDGMQQGSGITLEESQRRTEKAIRDFAG
ncbi:MAG TPA: hypothetical protein VMM76_25190 [Pirellulaceae bacterium]|nr:hypothetical protein [Pirellulaceae bacterium]